MEFLRRSARQLKYFNLFQNNKSGTVTDQATLRDQIHTTRIYVFLMTASLITFVALTASTPRSVSITVQEPSLETYERLQVTYPDTLSCPCQNIAILYKSFYSRIPKYHQVCSSGLVSSEWIESLFSPEVVRMTPLDFRVTAAAQFRMLAMACSVSVLSINNLQTVFKQEQLVSTRVLSPTSLADQAQALNDKFTAMMETKVTPVQGMIILQLIISQNEGHSALHTNSFVTNIPGSQTFQSIPNFYPKNDNFTNSTNYMDNFYTCNSITPVSYKAAIYTWALEPRSMEYMMTPDPAPVYVIPGMYVGCFPTDAVNAGTLECFFNSSCVNATAHWISKLPPNYWPVALNSSIKSRFSVSSPFSDLLTALMVEEWETATNFPGYYSACAPATCTYTVTGYSGFVQIITTLIGSFGGLTIVLRLISPQLLKLRVTITSFKTRRRKTDRKPKVPRLSLSVRLDQIRKWFQQKISLLNLFEDISESQRIGIIVTRTYIASVTMCVMILTFYFWLNVHTLTFTISHPSRATFESLHDAYPLTLTCPCSQVAIPQSHMANVSALRFHEICTSIFVTPVWYVRYFQINFANASQTPILSRLDFRYVGRLKFFAYTIVCGWSYNTITNAQAVFFSDKFISAYALSPSEFKVRTEAVIGAFQKQTATSIGLLSSLVQLSVIASGIESGFTYETIATNGSWSVLMNSPAPSAFNVCACSVSPECTIANFGFQCVVGNNCTANTTVWNIPGIISGCTHYENMLNSDLRCFYNQSCLNTILSLYNVDMPDRLPLPTLLRYVPALSGAASSRFLPTDSLQILFEKLMVEEWTIEANFDSYYQACAPLSCTYTTVQRLNSADLITTVFGLIGGLVLVVRLLILFITRIVILIMTYWHNRRSAVRHSETNEKTSIWNHVTSASAHIKNWLWKVNLFRIESSLSQMDNVQQTAITASRFYIVLLTSCIFILVLLNGLSETTVVVNVQSPSLATYQQLQMKNSFKLSCSCKQIAINYEIFFSMIITYHQICSSAFITPLWTTTLYGYGIGVKPYLSFDRPFLSKEYQVLGMLCEMSQSVVKNTLSSFNKTMLISALVLSPDAFKTQINLTITQLIDAMPLDLRRTVDFTTELIQSSLVPSAFNTDWVIEYGNASNDNILSFIPRMYANGTCNCAVSSSCQQPLRIGPPGLELPGLVVACAPINGLRFSTLECMFSENCVNTILSYLQYNLQSDGSLPSNFTLPSLPPINIAPLNQSMPSRFSPTTPIGELIDNLFIDNWQYSSSYEAYYAVCAPTMCRYEYNQRNSAAYIVTSLIAAYGGLTVFLRLLVWNSVRLYRWAKLNHRVHEISVAPRMSVI